MNLLVKKIKRVGHGFRNFENYRLRVEWYTHPPGAAGWNMALDKLVMTLLRT